MSTWPNRGGLRRPLRGADKKPRKTIGAAPVTDGQLYELPTSDRPTYREEQKGPS